MTYPSPHYDPNWKARCDAHGVERHRAERETMWLAEAGQMVSDAYDEAKARWKRHHAECLDAHMAQFETVQDYARWLFDKCPAETGFRDAVVHLPMVDFENFKTIEAVNAAWEHSHRIAQAAVADLRGRLPIGQPPGLTAFADATAPGLHRYRREFTVQDLYPGGYAWGAGVHTLITVDEQADGTHICFMHKGGSPGIAKVIENLATAVYREACASAAGPAAERKGWFGRLVGRKPARLDPARFHFYEHVLPAPSGTSREDFSRVELTFKDGKFEQPRWQRYDVIPQAIRSARFDLAAEGAGIGAVAVPRDERRRSLPPRNIS